MSQSPMIIAISGINATDNPGPGVAVARSLKKSYPNIRLIGLSYEVHDPGNYMEDLFENSFLLPYPTQGVDTFFSALSEVKEKTGINGIIPCLDAELPILIHHQQKLTDLGIRSFLPDDEQFTIRSKEHLSSFAKQLGCLHPRTQVAFNTDEVVDILKDSISFPAVIKGNYYKAYLVYNLETAILKTNEIAAEWGFPILVQERIQGKEINLAGLADGSGNLCGHVAIKKQLTTHLGKVWTAVTISDDRLSDISKTFCSLTHWRGPFELECISTNEGIYLIEINPRFPAWIYFATAVGVNLPEIHLKLLSNTYENAPEPTYAAGKYLVRYSSEFVTDLKLFQNLITKKNREGL